MEGNEMKHRKKANPRTVQRQLEDFQNYLREEERSPATMEKYTRVARGFLYFSQGEISKETVCAYKQHLIDEGRRTSTINGDLSAIRSFLRFSGREDISIRNMRCQRSHYISENRMLKRSEYDSLVRTAAELGRPELALLLESICSTGIRVSELQYISVEAVAKGEAEVILKGKTRKVFIPDRLGKKLREYVSEQGIETGAIFRNSKGRPIHRSYVWQLMKLLAEKAGVDSSKVFPHNLRRLFARSFYNVNRDIAKLADVLGHSSIDTTRIYMATTASEHKKILDQLDLVT